MKEIFRWTYRIQPTVLHKPFKACPKERFSKWYSVFDIEADHLHITPQQFRWKAMKFPAEDQKVTFIDGIFSMGGAGGPAMKVSLFFITSSRMASQYLSTPVIPALGRKLSTRQMEIS